MVVPVPQEFRGNPVSLSLSLFPLPPPPWVSRFPKMAAADGAVKTDGDAQSLPRTGEKVIHSTSLPRQEHPHLLSRTGQDLETSPKPPVESSDRRIHMSKGAACPTPQNKQGRDATPTPHLDRCLASRPPCALSKPRLNGSPEISLAGSSGSPTQKHERAKRPLFAPGSDRGTSAFLSPPPIPPSRNGSP